jgi:hypothetical protein
MGKLLLFLTQPLMDLFCTHLPLRQESYYSKLLNPHLKGIVLGHLISERGIEVDRAKIEVIEQLSPPVNIKGIRSFLGHAGFYHRFIKRFLTYC